jgi:hypothetical protein
MIRFYCQICGKSFDTQQYEQRCCSPLCGGELRRRRLILLPRSPMGRVQTKILDMLRTTDGDEVSKTTLASAMYGSSGLSEQCAIKIALYRLRAVWRPHGLVIETRVQRRRLDADGETFYRLVQDFDETLGVAS